MTSVFCASWASGAIGICIGNRLDVIKTELQAGNRIFTSSARATLPTQPPISTFRNYSAFFRGAAAPIIGYGALNSILFVTYNRALKSLDPSIFDPTKLAGVNLGNIWLAGAVGGLACWFVSAPTELIKCRTQLQIDGVNSSYATMVSVLKRKGIKGLYCGGTLTSIRDSFGYAWYFWSYELTKRLLLSRHPDPFQEPRSSDVLIAGGIAGVITWTSVFPLDVVKTRVQTQTLVQSENSVLLGTTNAQSRSSWQITRDLFRTEGVSGFYRGVGICSVRAFLVNAVQWYLYENLMRLLLPILNNPV